MTEIAELTAKAFRTVASVEFGSGCPTLMNDKALSESANKYVCELLGRERTLNAVQLSSFGGKSSKSAGSEDFAHVSQRVPSIMLALAAGNPEEGYLYPQHHPKVMFDENALAPGCAVYAYTAMRWLEEN
jgi:hippurate hydrolase